MQANTERLVYGSKAPNADELKQWQQYAPYFILPAYCALKRSSRLSEERRQNLLGHVAIQSADRETLHDLIGNDEARFANFYPNRRMQPTTTTEATIDSFLETFGQGNQRETDILTRMIFNPTPSYEATLAAEANAARRGNRTAPTPQPTEPDFVPEPEDEDTTEKAEPTERQNKTKPKKHPAETGNLSESLAKIMIKNGNYDKALEIITELSLNNPKKSVYFADQIRFLQKLIINKNKTIN